MKEIIRPVYFSECCDFCNDDAIKKIRGGDNFPNRNVPEVAFCEEHFNVLKTELSEE